MCHNLSIARTPEITGRLQIPHVFSDGLGGGAAACAGGAAAEPPANPGTGAPHPKQNFEPETSFWPQPPQNCGADADADVDAGAGAAAPTGFAGGTKVAAGFAGSTRWGAADATSNLTNLAPAVMQSWTAAAKCASSLTCITLPSLFLYDIEMACPNFASSLVCTSEYVAPRGTSTSLN